MTDASTPSTTTPASSIDALIGTYRELNVRVRPLPESTLGADHDGTSIRSIIEAMRDQELLFTQSLKERTTSLGPADEDAPPITGLESDDDSTAMLISQFGTARGTTLSTLKSLSSDAWTVPGPDGSPSLADLVVGRITQDREAIDQISSLLTT